MRRTLAGMGLVGSRMRRASWPTGAHHLTPIGYCELSGANMTIYSGFLEHASLFRNVLHNRRTAGCDLFKLPLQ
jgi:hypothetical protein